MAYRHYGRWIPDATTPNAGNRVVEMFSGQAENAVTTIINHVTFIAEIDKSLARGGFELFSVTRMVEQFKKSDFESYRQKLS